MTKKTALVAPDNVFRAQDFANTPCVIVAVSGGGDSMALLVLLREYLSVIKEPPRLIAVTVDHGLRAQSAEEARAVAAFCKSHAIEHETIYWQGEKPRTGLMVRARMARYQLLYQCAHSHHAKVIFTGHNLDDLAETYLMRAARQSYLEKNRTLPRGLAAMSRQSLLWQDVRLIRPLLGVRRLTLRQMLKKRAIRWIDDPSNEDRRFERVRLRQDMDEIALTTAAAAAGEAARQRRAYNACVVKFIQHHPIHLLGELCQLDLEQLAKSKTRFLDKACGKNKKLESLTECLNEVKTDPGLEQIGDFAKECCKLWSYPEHFLLQFLTDLACLVGGTPYLRPAPPQFLALLQNGTVPRFTWAGCVIEKHKTKLCLWREQRNLPTINLSAKDSALWDGRYHITNNCPTPIIIRPARMEEVRIFAHTLNIPASCLLATPAIISQKGVDLPILSGAFIHHRYISLKRVLAPFYFLQAEEEHDLITHWHQIFEHNMQKRT